MSRALLPVVALLIAACSSTADRRGATLDQSTSETGCASDPFACSCLEGEARPCSAEVGRSAAAFLCAEGQQRCQAGKFSTCQIGDRAKVHSAPLSQGCLDGPSTVGLSVATCDEGISRVCHAVIHWDPDRTACFPGHQTCRGGSFRSCRPDEWVADVESLD